MQTADRDAFARDVFATIPNLRDIHITTSEPLRIGGQQGHQILAEARDPTGTAAMTVVQWLRFGSGAREESLRFIEQLGVRNVLVESRPATSQEEFQQRRRSSPGLSARDVRILKANIEALETLAARKAMHPARVLPKPS